MKFFILLGLVSLTSTSFAAELTCKSIKTERVYRVDLEKGALKVETLDAKTIYEIPSLILSSETIDLYPVAVLHSFTNKENGQTVLEYTESEGRLFADFEAEINIPCHYN